MAVLDHPVHEKVRELAGAKYGCFNRKPYSEGYYAPSRVYKPDGTFYIIQTFIPMVMSRECRYDMSLTDSKCAECKHQGSGEAYNERIRANGS